MLTMAIFLILQEVFVGVGAGSGTSFTDTKIHSHTAFQITAYPFKNFGMFYRFSLSNPQFFIKAPFTMDKGERLHVFGVSTRLFKKNFQPWIESGLALYRERISVSLFSDEIFNEKQGRIAAAVSGGLNLKIWNKLYLIPAGRIVGGHRPFWQVDSGIAWKFGGFK